MKIAIFGQFYKNDTAPIVKKVIETLQTYNVEIIFEKSFLETLWQNHLITEKFSTFSNHLDLDENIFALISIGGDGTILKAATLIRNKNIPIVGVNAGRLGFLATIQYDNIEVLFSKLIKKEFYVSKRSLLSVSTNKEENIFTELNFALNEVTVARKDTTSMITITTHLNQEYLTSYWADGLIISTPTGSTGYSLSCGGPVIMPSVNAFVITPMAPHNLNARPLVIPDNLEIRLKISGRENYFLVSLDARIKTVSNETEIIINKSPFTINVIEFKEESFLNTLRKKLLWGEDKRN